jgi:hypothetical protein
MVRATASETAPDSPGSSLLFLGNTRCSFSFLLARKPKLRQIALHDEEQLQRADAKRVRIAPSVLLAPLLSSPLVRNCRITLPENFHRTFAANDID